MTAQLYEMLAVSLYLHGTQSTGQLAVTTGYHRDNVIKSCRKLRNEGMVEACKPKRMAEQIWYLTAEGAATAAQLVEDEGFDARTWPRLKALAYHDALASEVFVRLVAETRGIREVPCGVVEWLGPRLAARLYPVDADRSRSLLKPDGTATVVLPDRQVDVHLELDTGAQSLGIAAEKARAYATVLAVRGHGKENVLFVTALPGRVENLARMLKAGVAVWQKGAGGKEPPVGFWVASLEALEREGALGKIWLSAEGRLCRFGDLPSRARGKWSTDEFVGYRVDRYARDAWGRFARIPAGGTREVHGR